MTTTGKSKKPEQIVHHAFWYYRISKSGNLLDHIYCDEHNTSYPSSKVFKEEHPEETYMCTKNIRHIPPRRRF